MQSCHQGCEMLKSRIIFANNQNDVDKNSSPWSSEKQLFFKRWIKNPLSLGAILPSSRNLSRFMGETVVKDNRDLINEGYYVLEIGAGTGSFTRALLDAGVPPAQLICVELDPKLFSFLKKRFPDVTCICGDASDLKSILPPAIFSKIATVVSGIPMINIPFKVQEAIIASSFSLLGDTGLFYQFTYSPFSSIPANAFKLTKKRVGTVFFNFPPATVWSYRRSA
jgi:phosphatidylethanolamine/phosphatidyl-N-methylethanolamine N-methyltransferase